MIKLAVNLSNPLIELINEGSVTVDMVEVGPWYKIEKIRKFQHQLPGLSFLYHGSNQILKVGTWPGVLNNIKHSLKITNSPWASMHLSLLPPGFYWISRKLNIRLPRLSPEWCTNQFIHKAKKLSQSINVPLILENMPGLRYSNYDTEIDPDHINLILKRNGYNLLLDIAHARVAAQNINLEIDDYLSGLPLENVMQIHISGVRNLNGWLYDAHEILQQEDLEILEWILPKTNPQVVTLEYFRAKEPLCNQIQLLQEVLYAR